MQKAISLMCAVLIILVAPMFIGCGGEDPTEPSGWDEASNVGSNSIAVKASGASASGSAHYTTDDGKLRTFSFTASRHPDGTVKGQATTYNRSLDVRLHMAVDCLVVSGNVAVMSGVTTSASDPMYVGQVRFWAVEDNGQGAAASPDRVTLAWEWLGPQTNPCALVGIPPESFWIPTERGNVQVKP